MVSSFTATEFQNKRRTKVPRRDKQIERARISPLTGGRLTKFDLCYKVAVVRVFLTTEAPQNDVSKL
jgi:hypothetical protein